MTDSPNNPGPADTKPDSGAAHSADRRRWLQAGISAAPVIMTVASRPLLAADCNTPSGFLSGNLSGSAGTGCFGFTPSTWDSKSTYPTYKQKDAKFKDFFSPDLSGHTDIKMKDVFKLSVSPGSKEEVAQYVLAALLNHEVGSGPGSVPDSILSANTTTKTGTIHDIWSQYNNGLGVYAVNASVSWNGAQIITYLKTTMG